MCLDKLGLETTAKGKWSLIHCDSCEKMNLCKSGRKKIIDFTKFFDNAKPKRHKTKESDDRMKEILNIDKLNEDQLKELRTQIDRKLNGFWDIVGKLCQLDEESDRLSSLLQEKEHRLKSASPEMQAIEDLGFVIVFYSSGKIGFIDYTIPKEHGLYCGISFDKESNSISFDNFIVPEVEKIEKVEEILKDVKVG